MHAHHLLLLLTTTPHLLLAADAPPPKSTVTITATSYSGSGCPLGSVSTILAPDHSTVTFGFDRFHAFIGPRANPADAAKACALRLDLRFPRDYRLAVVRATHHAYVRLDDGVAARFESRCVWASAGKGGNTALAMSGTMNHEVKGGRDFKSGKMHEHRESMANGGVETMSHCGAGAGDVLNVNNRISLTSSNKSAEGEFSSDDATVSFRHKLDFEWHKCQSGGGDGGKGSGDGGKGKGNGGKGGGKSRSVMFLI